VLKAQRLVQAHRGGARAAGGVHADHCHDSWLI
jgi:hypothetical protein